MFICKYCGKEFDKKTQLTAHLSHCKHNPNVKTKQKEYSLICKKCGKPYKITTTEYQFNKGNYKQYCSQTCSNSHVVTSDTKQKISNSVIQTKIASGYKEYKCIVCNNIYYKNYLFPFASNKICSKECRQYYYDNYNLFVTDENRIKFRNNGLKSAKIQSETRRSKNEIYFCELCEEYFSNVEHNKPIFNGWDADIIIHDIKYAVLWNGKWHYEKITKKHSVEQVQNRDKIKIKEIQNYGYTPYIIKDMGKYNSDFVKEQFDLFISYIAP